MARRPRGDAPGSWHHVVNRAIAKRPYFETRSDKRYFLARLADEVRAGRIELHAYTLMTTHYHLLVRSPVGQLSEAMRRAQCSYSRHFNRLRRRDGPLIRARYFSKRIDTDPYLRAVVRYIDDNAVCARVVTNSDEHEFGSARAYLGGRRPPWLTTDCLKEMAEKLAGPDRSPRSVYLAAFGPRSGEDIEALRDLVESRMRSARELDPLEDLVGSTPLQVRRWMQRKARLADGMPIGLPLCGPMGLRRAIERELIRNGEWLLERGGRCWRGSELTRAGLSRNLCGLSIAQIADLAGQSVWRARSEVDLFGQFLRRDAVHAERVERIAAEALAATLLFKP
jgi:REP element-mobilizing transposase RayT